MAPLPGDIEHIVPTIEYVNGFPSVAAFIAHDRDNTSTIYRRFDRLAARNLLYLQSRLQQLEAVQDDLDKEDLYNGDIESKKAAISWEDFQSSAKTRERERKRMQAAEDIQLAMRNYHEALLFHSGVLQLQAPADRTLRAFKKWFQPEGPGGRAKLRGYSSRILEAEDDLIALRVPRDQDRFTALMQNHLPWLFLVKLPLRPLVHKISSEDPSIAHLSERKLARFVTVFSVVLAAILLLGAIVALYCMQSQTGRIGMIAIFTTLFAVSMGLFTNAKRTEIFAGTATYAAVLVVFISGNVSSGEI